MRHCPSCGHENPEGALACAQCGRGLMLTAMEGSDRPNTPYEPTGPPAEQPDPELPPPPPPPFTPPVQFPGAIPPGPMYGMTNMTPPPIPFRQPPLTGKQKTARYFIGIGLGLAPALIAVALVLIAGGIGGNIASDIYNVAVYAPCLAGLVLLGLMIYFLTQERLRPIGYGLLTVLVAAPVIAAVGCIVILSQARF